MKAFIIAGGEGTRLRPYTYSTPKPLLMLGGKPILLFVIENLRRFGIKDLVVTIGYMHEQISSHFGDGKSLGVKMEYLVEKTKRGTAGSIFPYKGKLKEPFFVVMGDHLTNIDMNAMRKHHEKESAFATIAVYRNRMQLEYGVADVKDGRITGFREKPLLENLYNTAIYYFEPGVFDYIKDGDDFAKDVIPRMLKDGRKISAYVFEDVWFDIGRVSDYERLDELMKVIRLSQDLGK